MNFVLGFVFFLFVMLLALIFGDKLSVVGRLHGRWFNTLADGLAELWDLLCTEVDRTWCFVLEHIWWVLALGSGTVGVSIVAWIMFGGIVDHSRAAMIDAGDLLNAGGLLDHTPVIDSRTEWLPDPARTDPGSITRVVHQMPSAGRLQTLPAGYDVVRQPPGRRIDLAEADTGLPDFPPLPLLDRIPAGGSDLEWLGQSDAGEPDLRLSLQSIGRGSRRYSDAPIVETQGRVLEARGVTELVADALRRLARQRSQWRDSRASSRSVSGATGRENAFTGIRENTAEQMRELERGLRVVLGSVVSDSDLRIEKVVSDAPRAREVELEVRITNVSRRRMSGLIVRELLPLQWQPVSIGNDGLYRDKTVTWLVNDLRPFEKRVLTLAIRSEYAERYDSETEISALAAVISETEVHFRRRNGRPSGAPDVRLRTGKIPESVDVDAKVDVVFRLQNVGAATAGTVTLRAVLPKELDHYRLKDSDVDREISIGTRDLRPGESKEIVLKVYVNAPGTHVATVEMLVDGRRADMTTFTVDARESALRSSEFPPSPF